MKHYIQIILATSLLALLFSCEKEIAFDNKLIEPKLVVNGFIQPDSLIDVIVATSKPIPGFEKDFEWISNATIQLFVDGVEKETLATYNIANRDTSDYVNYYPGYAPPSRPTKGYRSVTTRVEIGKTYKLEISHPNYKTVTCETKIPVPILIEKIDTLTKVIDDYGYSRFVNQVKIKFTDQPGDKNYYRIVYRRTTGTSMLDYTTPQDTTKYIFIYVENRGRNIYSDDPLINPNEDANDILFGSPSNQYNLFSDELIDGKTYELSFYIDNSFSGNSELIEKPIGEFSILDVELQSITREAYLYMRSVQASNSSEGNPFTEPVQVFSNIENGIGIFAGYSSNTKQISKGEYPIDGVEYRKNDNGGYWY